MTVCTHGTYPSQVRFSGNQPKENPETPLRQRPTRSFERHFFSRRLRYPARIARVIAHDGRAYRDTRDPDGSPPVTIMTDRVAFGAAERYDLLVQPERAGEYRLHLDWYHWAPSVNTQPLATRSVPVYCEAPA